jgi:hypothetical protein
MIDSSAQRQHTHIRTHVFCRAGCSYVKLCLLILLVHAGSRPACADQISDARTRALGDIFADDHVVDAALGIHERAMALAPEDRFAFLAEWVLPTIAHSTLRLDVAFSPTYPAQAGSEPKSFGGQRVASGGEIVCPAMDLIDTATQLNKLATIRAAVRAIKPRNRIEEKQLAAFRCLIEFAANNVDGALADYDAFLKLTNATDPQSSRYRADEMLLMLKATTTPELKEAMADYVRQVLVTERWPTYFDVWSRQLTRLAFQITPAMIEDQTSTLTDLPQINASPKFWAQVTYPLAARRGVGMPVAQWLFTPSQAINVANHGDDAVYFNIPLVGDLNVEADATVSNWREAEMIVGARWVGTAHQADLHTIGTVRQRIGDFKSARPTTRMDHWYRHRTSIKGQVADVSLDGNKVHQETFGEIRDPWIGIRSRHLNEGGARNVLISGSPKILETIDLIGSGLDSWFDYYAVEDPWEKLTWSLNDGEIIGQRLPASDFGTMSEKALFYHRPMLEDGTIEYEFYYQAGETCAHPAIDRMCFLLDDDHVALHQLTDGIYDQAAADPANLSSLPPRSKPLPLKQGGWNRMQVSLRGDVIALILNGEQVAEQTLPATNQRFFGLFYYADQEGLRVRNIRWSGDWQRTLPTADENELAGSQSDFLDRNREQLKARLHHDFSKDGVPPELFRLAAGEWNKDVSITKAGLLMKAVTTRVSSVSLGHTIGGDFDIYARYTAFQSAAEGAGARLMTRLQNPALREVIGGRKHMIHSKVLEENVGFLWHGFYDAGVYSYEYDKGQNIEETAGTVRLSRRGDTIHILTAEEGSEHYRLHTKQKAGAEDLSAGGIQLQCEMPGASVVWTALEIHAERISTCKQVIAELDDSRSELEASSELNFSTSSYDKLLIRNPDVKWVADSGLRMQHSSQSPFPTTPMTLNEPMQGNFDVTLEFEIEKLTKPVGGESSFLAFQIELADPEWTRYQAVLFHDPSGTNRLVVHRQCRSARTGKDETTEFHAVVLKTLTTLRITRRDQTIAMIATSPEYSGEFVLAQFQQSLPPLPTKLNVFARAGGRDAEISILLKKLSRGHQPAKPRPQDR